MTNPGETISPCSFAMDVLEKALWSSPFVAPPAAGGPGLREDGLAVCEVFGLWGEMLVPVRRFVPAGTVPGLSVSLPLPFRPVTGQPDGGNGGVDATVDGVSA